MYAGIYVSAASTLFFPTEHDVQERQHLRDEVGTWQNNTKQRAVISVQKRPRHHEDSVSEAQIDNRHMSTVSSNTTIKDPDIAACSPDHMAVFGRWIFPRRVNPCRLNC